MAVIEGPGTRRITTAIKRWETTTSTEAVVYEPDRITRYRSNRPGADDNRLLDQDTVDNPLGVVPVVQVLNVTGSSTTACPRWPMRSRWPTA